MSLFAAQRPLWDTLSYEFYRTFIEKNRYELFLNGLLMTLVIAISATILGALIGSLVSIVRVAHDQNEKPGLLIRILNRICVIYLALFRGTPIVVQLFIMYYIVFTNISSALLIGIFAFAINSGAYMAEIVRAGIMSIDVGQREAGLSIGLSKATTMRLIVLPQAIKNVLPALGNEFITLLKETSVVQFITIKDFMFAGTQVRTDTASPYMTFLSVALVYFLLVWGFTSLLKRLERRMRKSDRR